MDTLSRRTVLFGIGGAGASALLTPPMPVQSADPAVADTEELFLAGSYNLGEWFTNSKVKIEGLFNLGAPARDAIAKSLGECWVYVVDLRLRTAAGQVRFGKNDYPRVAITGPFRHEWKEEKKEFAIQIASAERNALSTDHTKPKPTREFSVVIKLMTAGQTTLATTATTTNFCVGPIAYDIEGRVL